MTVTFIAPTQPEENRLGFDEIVEGLPPGRVIAIQFKRPHQLVSPPNVVRFQLDTSQISTLYHYFGKGQAFLFLTPLPKNNQIVKYRRRLLPRTIALDIHDVPRTTKQTQTTRNVRVYPQSTLGSTPLVTIADPRKFEAIENPSTAAQIADSVCTGDIGFKLTKDYSHQEKPNKEVKEGMGRIYYIHVTPQTNFQEPKAQ